MTSILPTIGPVSENRKNINKILKYSDIVRINGSHNTIQWHEKISSRIKNINRNSKILLDVPGIKPRTDNNQIIKIKKGEIVVFYYKKKLNKNTKLQIKLTNSLPKIDKNCKTFTVSDGQYEFALINYNNNYIMGKSKNSFELLPKKGVNIPYSEYSDTEQKKVYKKFLKKAYKVKYDAIGLSFIQNEKILKELKKTYPKIALVAKIENYKAINNLDNICENADVIMIDRGDLSAEIGEKNLFSAIINISKKAKEFGKPLIMATENLDSMMIRDAPTKSEIVSIGFSLMLEADKIMLSEETAIAKNWEQIIYWLDGFIKNNIFKNNNLQKFYSGNTNIIWDLLKTVKNLPIIIFSKKGFAIENAFKLNKNINLTVFTDNPKIATICEFRSKTNFFLVDKFNNSTEYIFKNIKKNKKIIFYKHNTALLIYISYPRKKSRANSITLISKEDFK